MTDPKDWIGKERTDPPGDIACERGYVLHWLEATENANPRYWDEGCDEAPPSMISVWMRPLQFVPGRDETFMPLSLHFDLKEAFDLPDGVVVGQRDHVPRTGAASATASRRRRRSATSPTRRRRASAQDASGRSTSRTATRTERSRAWRPTRCSPTSDEDAERRVGRRRAAAARGEDPSLATW